MLLRSFFLSFSLVVSLLLTDRATAQEPPPTTPAPAQTSQAPAPGTTSPRKPSEPDYPDPRTFTIGLFYWYAVPGSGPDIRGGKLASGYESVFGIGKYKPAAGAEISFPITRTGELHIEGFQSNGTGNQNLPRETTIYGTSYIKGDYLATQYKIRGGKLYLEDLLYPYKFPVSRFRLKSIWAVQFASIKSGIDAPLKTITTDSNGNTTQTLASGTGQVILPMIGLVAEYAVSPHVLFRVGGSGFGLPHKSSVWDAQATISYRHNKWEILGGGKALHVKTTPQKDEYVTAAVDGAFVGVRWHF